jgi:hypothetical protein
MNSVSVNVQVMVYKKGIETNGIDSITKLFGKIYESILYEQLVESGIFTIEQLYSQYVQYELYKVFCVPLLIQRFGWNDVKLETITDQDTICRFAECIYKSLLSSEEKQNLYEKLYKNKQGVLVCGKWIYNLMSQRNEEVLEQYKPMFFRLKDGYYQEVCSCTDVMDVLDLSIRQNRLDMCKTTLEMNNDYFHSTTGIYEDDTTYLEKTFPLFMGYENRREYVDAFVECIFDDSETSEDRDYLARKIRHILLKLGYNEPITLFQGINSERQEGESSDEFVTDSDSDWGEDEASFEDETYVYR